MNPESERPSGHMAMPSQHEIHRNALYSPVAYAGAVRAGTDANARQARMKPACDAILARQARTNADTTKALRALAEIFGVPAFATSDYARSFVTPVIKEWRGLAERMPK